MQIRACVLKMNSFRWFAPPVIQTLCGLSPLQVCAPSIPVLAMDSSDLKRISLLCAVVAIVAFVYGFVLGSTMLLVLAGVVFYFGRRFGETADEIETTKNPESHDQS